MGTYYGVIRGKSKGRVDLTPQLLNSEAIE